MNSTQRQWTKVTLFILIAIAAVIGAAQFPARVTEAQGGTPLTYGASAFGAVAANTPAVSYTFNGTMGDLVEIDVQSVSGTLNPAADLIGPDQMLLANGQYHRLTMRSNDAHIAAFLTQNGPHTITVSGLNGSVGDFVLRLNGRPWASPIRLAYDVALDVNIVENAPIQYFDFETGDCPTTLIVTNLFGGEPYTFPFVVRVRDWHGQEVALLRGGNAQEDRVTLPANSGRYEVEVFADDPSLMGLVSLLITCAENAPGCGADGTPGADDATCSNCPDCDTFDRPDRPRDSTECPDMDPRAVVINPEVRGTLLTWNAVPGAEAYLIHIVGLRDDGEHDLGAAGAPGDATEFMFDHLFPGFYGFRFVIEALVSEAPICSGETMVTFLDTVEVCPEMTLRGEVTSDADRSIRWTWNPFPGEFDGYFLAVGAIFPDGSGELRLSATLPPEATSFDTFHPVEDPPTGVYAAALQIIVGDSLICPATAIVEFTPEGGTCEDFEISVAVSPEDNVEVHWPLVTGAAGYAINITTSDGVSVPGYPAGAAPDQDWHYVSGLAPGSYTVSVTVHSADGAIMCQDSKSLQIGGTPECSNFALGVVANADGTITANWPPYPGAIGYYIRLLDETGLTLPDGYPLTELDPSYNSYTFVAPPPGNYTVYLAVLLTEGHPICPQQMPVTTGGQDQTPCEVVAEREGVQVHVGPGRHRSVWTYMDMGRPYLVTGFNYDPDGFPWWQLDKTQFPGHEAVFSLWVAESDVTEHGNCTDIPLVDIPDIVPGGDDGGGDGGWGACGSCNSCGHPASECVTDPGGACVWDPSTCGGGDPDDPGDPGDGGGDPPGDPGDPPPQCVFVTASVEPAGLGSAGPITSGNCFSEIAGNYTPGTFVQVRAVPNSGCWLDHWSGCGLSGNANPAGFTVNATCHAVAHIQCIQ